MSRPCFVVWWQMSKISLSFSSLINSTLKILFRIPWTFVDSFTYYSIRFRFSRDSSQIFTFKDNSQILTFVFYFGTYFPLFITDSFSLIAWRSCSFWRKSWKCLFFLRCERKPLIFANLSISSEYFPQFIFDWFENRVYWINTFWSRSLVFYVWEKSKFKTTVPSKYLSISSKVVSFVEF